MHISLLYLVTALSASAFGTSTRHTTQDTCSNAALEKCLSAKGVPFKVRCDSDWADFSRTHNIRLPVMPAAVVLPDDSKHISAAVVCARKTGVKVQAKSGGHSYGSYSSGGIDGQVMVDLRNFNKTVLSADGTAVAVVGGGVRLGSMATAVYAQGKRAISHGVCPSVGIGGHATHGGWGYTSRAWGLTLDHILEMQVVLANGTEVLASPDSNPDLYWALRGAADSIGIVTSFTLRTQPAPEEVINFTYQFPTVAESVEQSVNAVTKLQNFINNSTAVDRRFSFGLQTFVTPDATTGNISKTFVIDGTFIGSLNEYTASIEPEMLRGLPAPTARDVQSHDWIASLVGISAEGTLTPNPIYLDFFANSVTVDNPGMNQEALTSYFTYMLDGPVPPAPYVSSMDLWGGADSQINLPEKNVSFAAFPHRNVFWTIHNLAQAAPNASFPAEGVAHLNGLRHAIIEGLNVKSAGYLNLLDVSLTREEAHALYYGDEVLARLERVKSKYDPVNVFWNPQSL